jgi:hypothetical protein
LCKSLHILAPVEKLNTVCRKLWRWEVFRKTIRKGERRDGTLDYEEGIILRTCTV